MTYGLHRHTCRLGLLGDGVVDLGPPVAAELEGGADPGGILAVVGRGRSLHAVTADGWYRFDLEPA